MEDKILKKFNYPFWARNEVIIPTEYGWERVLKNGQREILVAYKNLKNLLEEHLKEYKKGVESINNIEIKEEKKNKINATITSRRYRQGKYTIFNLSINFPNFIYLDITNNLPEIKVIKEIEDGSKTEIKEKMFKLKDDPNILEVYNIKFKIRCGNNEICKFYIEEDAIDLNGCTLKNNYGDIIDAIVLEPKIIEKDIDYGNGSFGVKVE